jgi:hypothetical protein
MMSRRVSLTRYPFVNITLIIHITNTFGLAVRTHHWAENACAISVYCKHA